MIELLEEAILVGAVWTGKNSKEWDRLVELAETVPGLQEKLAEIKRLHEAESKLASSWS